MGSSELLRRKHLLVFFHQDSGRSGEGERFNLTRIKDHFNQTLTNRDRLPQNLNRFPFTEMLRLRLSVIKWMEFWHRIAGYTKLGPLRY